MPHPAVDYCERSVKKVEEEEEYELPPRKKIALAEQAGQGASNKPDLDGVSFMQPYRPIDLAPYPSVVLEDRITDNPSTEERLKTMDLRQKKLAERLIKMDSELRSIILIK